MLPTRIHSIRLPVRSLALALLITLLAGCGGDGAAPTTDGPSPPGNDGSASTTSTRPATSPPGSTTERPTTSNPATTTGNPTPPQDGRLDGPGFSLEYPEGWIETGAVIATEFGATADCAAVKVTDFEPPVDSGEGQAGYVLHSVVQICTRAVDERSLDAFVEDTYPGGTRGFEPTQIGGLDAFESINGLDVLVFAQNGQFRFQVATTVVADPDTEQTRVDQVREILATLTFE